jgi:hypothetical protein
MNLKSFDYGSGLLGSRLLACFPIMPNPDKSITGNRPDSDGLEDDKDAAHDSPPISDCMRNMKE